MGKGPKMCIAAGNVFVPNKVMCLQWVTNCCEVLSIKIFPKECHACGIFMTRDEMKNDEVLFLKEGGVAADARKIVKNHGDSFLTTRSRQYLFVDVGEELEESKVVL